MYWPADDEYCPLYPACEVAGATAVAAKDDPCIGFKIIKLNWLCLEYKPPEPDDRDGTETAAEVVVPAVDIAIVDRIVVAVEAAAVAVVAVAVVVVAVVAVVVAVAAAAVVVVVAVVAVAVVVVAVAVVLVVAAAAAAAELEWMSLIGLWFELERFVGA